MCGEALVRALNDEDDAAVRERKKTSQERNKESIPTTSENPKGAPLGSTRDITHTPHDRLLALDSPVPAYSLRYGVSHGSSTLSFFRFRFGFFYPSPRSLFLFFLLLCSATAGGCEWGERRSSRKTSVFGRPRSQKPFAPQRMCCPRRTFS